jgi:RNA polymerase sigma-70 factor (ECF subfamily)
MSSDTSEWRALREELAAAVAGGREDVMRRFYDQHFQKVYRFVICRIGNYPETEEIVSDVFYQAFRDHKQYDAEHPPESWLLGIARHRVLDVLRKRSRRPKILHLDEELPAGALDLEASEIPDLLLEREELAERIEWVLSEMNPDEEKILRWQYIDGKPVKEIAELLGINEKAAEARLFRARSNFRDAFKNAAREFDLTTSGVPNER